MKMKKLLCGSVIIGCFGISASHVLAVEVNGTDTATITVNGSLGQDNTDEDAVNIAEGSEDWINVTIDTANIFYTTKESQHKMITSPNYSIANNSGRAVKVKVVDFSVNSGNLDNVDTLKISGKDYSSIEKSIDLKAFTSSEFLTLANNQGKLNIDIDPAGSYAKTTSYSYSGTTKNDYYEAKAEKTAHTLTLTFEALGRDGVSTAP